MNFRLQKPELERFIDEQVKAGIFPSAEAVVEDALLRMMEEVELSEEDREGIRQSDEQIAKGEVVDYGDFAARIRQKYGIR
jgi:Arc/MetJ-type ribon-helix-helix transcriptional regulator